MELVVRELSAAGGFAARCRSPEPITLVEQSLIRGPLDHARGCPCIQLDQIGRFWCNRRYGSCSPMVVDALLQVALEVEVAVNMSMGLAIIHTRNPTHGSMSTAPTK